MNQCVAYCGGMDPKDFSVTTKLFPDAKRDAYQNYGKTFRAVSNWKADYAVVPYEKSLSGELSVLRTICRRSITLYCHVTRTRMLRKAISSSLCSQSRMLQEHWLRLLM